MAEKKNKKTEDSTEAQVVEHDIEDEAEKSPAEREVTEAGPMVFTVEVGGEKVELTDMYRKDRAPGAFMMIGRKDLAGKYLPGLVETLIGEDQALMLLDMGASVDELGEVTEAWAKGRGLKN